MPMETKWEKETAMKQVTFKTSGKFLSLFMTVFAVLGSTQSDKAYATTSEANTQKKTPFDSNVHGCGCGCSSCMSSSEISKSNKS